VEGALSKVKVIKRELNKVKMGSVDEVVLS
jgi:hypothetical protein